MQFASYVFHSLTTFYRIYYVPNTCFLHNVISNLPQKHHKMQSRSFAQIRKQMSAFLPTIIPPHHHHQMQSPTNSYLPQHLSGGEMSRFTPEPSTCSCFSDRYTCHALILLVSPFSVGTAQALSSPVSTKLRIHRAAFLEGLWHQGILGGIGTPWVAHSVTSLTLDFGSGHDLRIMRLSPVLGSMLRTESA